MMLALSRRTPHDEALHNMGMDLAGCGLGRRAVNALLDLYTAALERRTTSDWTAFYRAIFHAVQGADLVGDPIRRLLEDDFGTALFATVEIQMTSVALRRTSCSTVG